MLTKYLPYFVLFFSLLLTEKPVFAQQLTGVWSGKISRRAVGGNAYTEGLEIQLTQAGKQLWGNSFAFKDSSYFVLYRLQGKRYRKQKSITLFESGTPAFLLPNGFFPCEKKFKLNYFRLGKTQYLTGNWGGQGAFDDTTCFPNEELLVVLQKIDKPDYPIEAFVKQKLVTYFTKPRNHKNTNTAEDSTRQEKYYETPTSLQLEDSLLTNRLLDIQHIIKTTDSVIKISMYDNAIVDDDTVSVFVNKKPVLIKQRISTTALTFTIKAATAGNPVEILMQAENLGSIPPNTALMIIESGSRRYEVRLRSGFEKHAVIVITYEPHL